MLFARLTSPTTTAAPSVDLDVSDAKVVSTVTSNSLSLFEARFWRVSRRKPGNPWGWGEGCWLSPDCTWQEEIRALCKDLSFIEVEKKNLSLSLNKCEAF